MERILALGLILCCNPLIAFGQTKYLEPHLEYGYYQAGFKVFHEYDYSRTYEKDRGADTNSKPISRPIQISVWYPANKEKDDNPMPFKEYIKLITTQVDFDYRFDPLKHPSVEKVLSDPFINKDQFNLAWQANSRAIRDARHARGSFPLIIISPGGFGSGFENSTMAEFLASHGFIVASFATLNSTSEPFGPSTYESHSRDTEFVLGFMHNFPNTDLNKLGLLGFSRGGAAVTTVLSRNRKVKAVVTLDGSFNLKLLPFVDPNKFDVPFLVMNTGQSNLAIYDSLKSQDAYYVVFKTFGHCFFGSSWILLSNHDANDNNAVGGKQDEINLGYQVLCDYVLDFFDAYLNLKSESRDKLVSIHKRIDIPTDFLIFRSKLK